VIDVGDDRKIADAFGNHRNKSVVIGQLSVATGDHKEVLTTDNGLT